MTTPVVPVPTTSHAFMEMFLAQKMATILNGLTQESSSSVTRNQILGFLAMLSLEELRSVITELIGYIRNYLRTYSLCSLTDMYIFIKSMILHMCKYVMGMFRKPSQIEESIIKAPEVHTPCYINLDNELVANIINHKLAEKELHFEIIDNSIKIKTNTLHMYEKEEVWKGLYFKITPEITCYINVDLPVLIRKSKTNESISIRNVEPTPLVEKENYILIPRQGFLELGKRLMINSKHSDGLNYANPLYISKADESLVCPIFTERGKQNVAYLDGMPYAIISKYSSGTYLARICLLYEKIHKKKINNLAWQALTGSTSQFISFEHTYTQSKIDEEIEKLVSVNEYNCKHQYMFMVEQAEKGFFVEWKMEYKTSKEGIKVSTTYFTSHSVLGDFMSMNTSSNNILLSETSPSEIPPTNKFMREKFEEFLLSLRNTKRKDNFASQQMYYLAVQRDEKIIETPNSEYESWQETFKLLNPPSTDDKKLDSGKPVFFGQMPPKTVKHTKEVVSTYCKELGTCMKPLETLYLTEEDLDNLTSSLELFRDKKAMLQSLGIPNKYGLFLSGPPGTGKTSTVYAVATYLQKPIYYVSLCNIRTNKELSMLFEYVNQKTIGGGVIVFEDIDCMTDIVLKRGEEIATSVVDILGEEDDKLTLSYLLNIMDGVMSQDGMIVIASSNHPEKIDPAFLREGRFDIHIKLNYANHYQICMIFNKFFGRNVAKDVLERIPENIFTPAQFIFRFKNYVLRAGATDEEIMNIFIRS